MLGAIATANAVFAVIVLGVLAAIAVVVSSAPLRKLFRFGEPPPMGWALAAAGGLGCLIALEALKRALRLSRRRFRRA